MGIAELHQCKCPNCQDLGEHSEGELHRRMNLFLDSAQVSKTLSLDKF
jgi:hypothetical protein